MKKIKKIIAYSILYAIYTAMLVTGVYALVAFAIIFCAAEVQNIGNYILLTLSGVISGFICYLLHKITF